ncbi:MAG: SDR family oxidoreductase [Enterobacterales bacterium]|nr:SDR family oxidoreductase [Enterobacterales bacterium]
MRTIIICLLILTCSVVSAYAQEPTKKAVLVTGASSGSGNVITKALAAKGYYVFAGARKQKDLDALNAIENVHAIKLDVTIQSQIDAAVAEVTKTGLGLYGLVNNAGVGIQSPLIETAESELKFIFDVNVYGPYRITKAFAPLIIESQGRISTIGSVSGISSAPFYGPYSMTKHAMEAFNDSLAWEMEKFGVKVSIIEPGGFNSKIGPKVYQRLKNSGYDFENSRYKTEWETGSFLRDKGKGVVENNTPEEIANAVVDILESDSPKPRYLVQESKKYTTWTIQQAMLEMLQLNHDQAHSLTRAELVKLLDEFLAKDLSENPFQWDDE